MRERIAQLVQGTQIIDLNSVGGISVHSVLADASGSFEAMPQQFDVTGQGDSNELFTENWTLAIRNRRQDDVARQIHVLSLMLRDAWRYTFTSRQIDPVYLVVRAAGETNERYALVHSCPMLSGSNPLFGTAFEDHLSSGLFDVGIPILRYCWQDGPPGVLPSLETLTHTDQPADDTTIYVANHRDTAVLTHIYNLDTSVAAWSANLVAATSIPIWSVAAAVPAKDDMIYLGNDEATDRPFHHIAIPIATPGNFNAQVTVEYSIASMFLNNGFETAGGGGADIWADWIETAGDGALADEVVNFFSGAHACRATSGPTFNTKVEQPVTVVPGRVYDLSFWTRGDGVNAGRYAVYDVTNAAWIMVATTTGVSAAVYAKVTARVTAPAGCVSMRLDLMCPPVNAGVAYFDVVVPGNYATAPNDTKVTVLPACVIEGPGATVFQVATTWVINVGHLEDWAVRAANGVTGYWLRLRIEDTPVAWVTTPVTSATVAIYVPKTPEVRIPATAFPNGDTFPVARMLMHHPNGGDDDEGFPNTSRIIMGLKSRNLTNFVSHLNWANAGNPGAWASATAHADATQVADPQCPMGQAINVSFATDPSLQARWTLTGDDMLDDWVGTYRVFLRCRQVGGVVGEVSVALMVRLLALSNYNPGLRMPTKALATFDSGLEVVDFGLLTLPFIQMAQADVSLLGADLIFQVLASRNAAAATLRIADLILIPIDEWSAQYDDPLTDTQYGSSALRGRSALDVDGGVIRPRVIKQYSHLGTMTPTETWRSGGAWPKIPPGQAARLYFLMCHFRAGGTWGTGPYIATLGQMLAFQLYGRERYLVLRGNR